MASKEDFIKAIVWWLTPVIPVRPQLSLKDCHKPEASLDYIGSSRLDWAIEQNLVSKTRQTIWKKRKGGREGDTEPPKFVNDLKHGTYWVYAGSQWQENLEKRKSKIILSPFFQCSDLKARKWNYPQRQSDQVCSAELSPYDYALGSGPRTATAAWHLNLHSSDRQLLILIGGGERRGEEGEHKNKGT